MCKYKNNMLHGVNAFQNYVYYLTKYWKRPPFSHPYNVVSYFNNQKFNLEDPVINKTAYSGFHSLKHNTVICYK